MSTITQSPAIAGPRFAARGSTQLRLWWWSLACSIGLMFLCVAFGALEKYGFGWPGEYRLGRHPDSLAVRLIGFPHFWIGLMFALSSRRLATGQGRAWFAGLAVLAVVLMVSYNQLGGSYNPVLYLITFFYFLVHELRDQAFFFQNYAAKSTADARAQAWVLRTLQFMFVSLLFCILMPTYLQHLEMRDRLPAGDPVLQYFFPASLSFLERFAMYLLPSLAIDALLALVLHRIYPGGLVHVQRDFAPLLAIFAGYTVIVLATLVVGAGALSLVILMHVIGWYFFAKGRLAAHPAREPRTWWNWARGTSHGLTVLHIACGATLFAVLAISAYGFAKNDCINIVLGQDSFAYWTILHITISFVPR